MSRVDEALRRAGIKAEGIEPDAVPTGSEPYPIEMPDRQRTPPRAKAEPAPAAQSERIVELISQPVHAEDPSISGPSISGHRLFERFHPGVSEKVVIDRRMPAACREQYRRLAAILHDAQATNQTQVVMVASAVAGEGKTLTAANVSLTLSSSYRKRVLLIDADLRRPVLHQLFRVETGFGLADGLDPSSEMKMIVRQVSPTLALLPAGHPTPDPMAGLISERMRQLIHEARGAFDWIILDTPPLMLLPDAHLLASMADSALLVVKAESTPHALVKRAMDAIGRSKILGVVLNGASSGRGRVYDAYGDYYATAPNVAGV
jgi:protein-tyrosine kinase